MFSPGNNPAARTITLRRYCRAQRRAPRPGRARRHDGGGAHGFTELAITVIRAIAFSSAFSVAGCGPENAAPPAARRAAASIPFTEKARTAEMRALMESVAEQISKDQAREAAIAHQRQQGFLPQDYEVDFGPRRNVYGGWDVLINTLPRGPHYFIVVDKEGVVKNVVFVYCGVAR